MLWNVVAVALSALALACSTFLAVQQSVLMRRANHIPAYIDLTRQFRSLHFNDHYRFVVERLAEFDAQLGISGLPEEARAAVYDVAGLFQGIATLRLLDLLDKRIDAMVQYRTLRIWAALAPFVERERELQGTPGKYLWRILEEFAADTQRLSDDAVNAMINRHRQSGLRRLVRRGSSAGTAKAAGPSGESGRPAAWFGDRWGKAVSRFRGRDPLPRPPRPLPGRGSQRPARARRRGRGR